MTDGARPSLLKVRLTVYGAAAAPTSSGLSSLWVVGVQIDWDRGASLFTPFEIVMRVDGPAFVLFKRAEQGTIHVK